VLLAATAALLTATSLVATAIPPPPDPAVEARNAADEELVRNDLGLYTSTTCLTEAEALSLFRERLDALGFEDWTVRADGRYRDAPCVGAAAIGEDKEVMLLPSMGSNVADALDATRDELVRECLSTGDAIDRVRTTLIREGIADPRVVAGALLAVPLEHADAYLEHVANGCAVYGGAQFDESGRYTWTVSGG
jgi:hypothetical protein